VLKNEAHALYRFRKQFLVVKLLDQAPNFSPVCILLQFIQGRDTAGDRDFDATSKYPTGFRLPRAKSSFCVV
jgi:hypothetical protein